MSESILENIKALLGVVPEDTSFDQQITMCINTALNAATQIGIGPPSGFTIKDGTATWTDLIGEDVRLEAIKNYIGIRTRILFDPPVNGSVLNALQESLTEIEWRLRSDAEHPE